MTKNKVKYNLKNVYYAKITEDETGKITFAVPVPIPGAVSLSMDAEGELSNFYADGIAYYTSSSNNGYSGDLEIALIPDSFRTEILNEEKDTNGVLIENANNNVEAFALLFQFDGDVNAIKHVLYNCKAIRPSVSSETKEETITPNTETLSLNATPLPDGRVKAKTGEETSEETYASWFTKVYEPAQASA